MPVATPLYDIEKRKLDVSQTIQQDDPFTDEIIAQIDKITGKKYDSASSQSSESPANDSLPPPTTNDPFDKLRASQRPTTIPAEFIDDPFTPEIIAAVDKITGKKYSSEPATGDPAAENQIFKDVLNVGEDMKTFFARKNVPAKEYEDKAASIARIETDLKSNPRFQSAPPEQQKELKDYLSFTRESLMDVNRRKEITPQHRNPLSEIAVAWLNSEYQWLPTAGAVGDAIGMKDSWAKRTGKEYGEALAPSFDAQENPWGLNHFAQVFGNGMESIAESVATRGLLPVKSKEIVQFLAWALPSGIKSAGLAYNNSMDKMKNDPKYKDWSPAYKNFIAIAEGAINGAVEVASEKIGFEGWGAKAFGIRPAKKFNDIAKDTWMKSMTRFAKEGGKATTFEWLEEMASSAGQDIAAAVRDSKDSSIIQTVSGNKDGMEALTELAQTTADNAVGVLSTFFLGGAGEMTNFKQQSIQSYLKNPMQTLATFGIRDEETAYLAHAGADAALSGNASAMNKALASLSKIDDVQSKTAQSLIHSAVQAKESGIDLSPADDRNTAYLTPFAQSNIDGQDVRIDAIRHHETGDWHGIIDGQNHAPFLLPQEHQDTLNRQHGHIITSKPSAFQIAESSQSAAAKHPSEAGPTPADLISHARQRYTDLSAKKPALMDDAELGELSALEEAFKNPNPEKLLADIYPASKESGTGVSPVVSPLPQDRPSRIAQAMEEEKQRVAAEKEVNYYKNMNKGVKQIVKTETGLDAKDIPPGFAPLFREAGNDPVKLEKVIGHIEAHLKDKTPIPVALSAQKKSTAPVQAMNRPDVNTLTQEAAQAELDNFNPADYTPGMAGARKEQLRIRIKELQSPVISNQSPVTSNQLPVTSDQSPVTSNQASTGPTLEQSKRSHHAQPVKVTDLTNRPKDNSIGATNKDLNKQDIADYAKETGQTPAAIQKQADEFDTILKTHPDFGPHFISGSIGDQLKAARKDAADQLALPNTIEIQSPAERAKALPALKAKLEKSPQSATADMTVAELDVASPLSGDVDTSFDPDTINDQIRNLAAKSKPSGITPEQIRPVIDRITRRWKNAPKITIVQFLTDLPLDLKKGLLKGGVNPRGVYFGKDGVFLVSDNLENIDDAGFVLLHESVGHYGLRGVFGDQLDPVLAEIFRTNQDVRTKAMEMIRGNRTMSHVVATEEVISDMAGKFQGWQRLVYAIRKALRRMGIVNTYSNDQIMDIIHQSRKFVQSGKPNAKIGSANASKESGTGVSPVIRNSPANQRFPMETYNNATDTLNGRKLPTGMKAIFNLQKIKKAILEIYDYALSAKPAGSTAITKKGIAYRNAETGIINLIKSKGFDVVENMVHAIDNYSIQHSYNRHADEQNENQLPLTKEDYAMIPEITVPENAVDVRTQGGLPVIKYRKKINGHTIILEEVRNGRKELSFLSMWKIKSPENLAGEPVADKASVLTSDNAPVVVHSEDKSTLLLSPAKSSPDAENPLRLSPKPRYDNPDQLNFFSDLDNPQPAEPAPAIAAGMPSMSSTSSKSSSIEDFGQKIGGARKDYYAQYGSNMQIAKQKDIATSSLSEVFPEPDYQKLIDGGLNPEIAGFIKAMRDVIPTKPRGQKARYYMQRYVDSVTQIREFSEKLISGEWSFENTKEKIKEYPNLETQIADKAELYAATGLDRNLKDYKVGQGVYSVYAGVKFDKPMEKWSVSKDFRILADGNTKAEAIANFANYLKTQTPQEKTKGGTTFDVWQIRATKDYVVGKKIAAGKFVTLQTGFKTAREAFDHIKQNQEPLEAQLEKLKDIPDERAATNADRIGTDYRQGKDVTPEIFQNQFGFKGVEFGNWVEQDRRQEDLNNAFDALMDMANVLNVPPKALSLNGKLGIGFGSRGTGGVHPAKAHYEPDFIAINLTKNNGPGSLAHEFWHALDNYFENQRGNVGKYMSENTRPQISRDGKTDNTRAEMLEAFKRINDAISNTGLVERSERLDSTRTKDYWSTTREMTARAFEWWIKDRLAAQNSQNDYLVNFLDEDTYNVLAGETGNMFPYVNQSEGKIISDAFDNFFATIQTKEEEGRVMLLSPAKSSRSITGNEISSSKELPTLRRDVVKWAKTTYKGKDHEITVDSDGADILIPFAGVTHAAWNHPTIEKLQATYLLDDLVKTSKFLRREEPIHGKPTVTDILVYGNSIEIDGAKHDVELIVRKTDTKRYYDHLLIKNPKMYLEEAVTGTESYPRSSGLKETIRHSPAKSSPDSKIPTPTTDDQRPTTSNVIPQSVKFTFNPEALRTINDEIYKKAVENKKKYYMELRRNANLAPSNAFATGLSRIMAPISTRLGNIAPSLRRAIRNFEFKINQATLHDVDAARPFLEGIRTMSSDDRITFDLARKNADSAKIAELVKKYGLEDAYIAYRNVMDSLHSRAKDVGFDVKYLAEYHPRLVKDKAGLLMFLRGSEDWGNISKAFDEKSKELGRTLSEGEKADIANSVLRGYGPGLKLGGPGNLKSRKIAFVTNELNKFYHDSDTALIQYIERVNNAVETRRFFGKSEGKITVDLDIPEVEKSIGEYVRDLVNQRIITEAQENEVASILQARFGYMGMGRNMAFMRDIGYLTTMSSISSTITQIGDMAWALYMSGIRLDIPVKNFFKAAFNMSNINRTDIGVERIGEEFRSVTKLNKILQNIFTITGFSYLDRLGKEALINTVVDRIQSEARSGKLSDKTRQRLESIFGTNTQGVIEELKGDKLTDNVKLLAFSTLLDFQPIALSEMPEQYLKSPGGRIFYMLKSFTVRQLDVFRRECISKMTSGKNMAERAEGLRNLMHLSALFMLANGSADIIKDLIFGRKTEPEDYVIDNILRLFGLSRYIAWNARRDGLAKSAANLVLPPFNFIESPLKDADKLARAISAGKTDDFQVKDMQSWKNVPYFGPLYYWWFGGGQESTNRKEQLANPDHKEIMRIAQRVAGGAKTSDLDYKDRLLFARNRTEIINRARDYRRTAQN